MRQIITFKHLPAPKFRYSPCVKTGPFYQMAGMIGLDLEGGKLVEGGPEVETRKILQNLANALPDLDMSLDNLVSATVFTTQFDRFPLINKAWEEVFTPDVVPPARTAVGVAALPLGASVEIEFRLYKKE